MRGRTGLIPLLSFLLLLPLAVGMQAVAQSQTSTQSVYYTVTQGNFSATLAPIQGSQSVVDFYNYSNFQSNTGLEVSNHSLLFLYEDTTTGNVSLVMIQSKADSNGSADFQFSGLPSGVQFEVKDDPDDTWTLNPPTGEVQWTWSASYNDGGALGPLTNDFNMTITPDFVSGIQEWDLVSGTVSNPQYQTIPSMTDPVTITAQAGTPPTASFTVNPTSPGVGVPVTFDASASRPAAGQQIVKYEWDFNGDGTYEQSSTSPTTQYTFTATGSQKVTLRVTDDNGVSATTTQTINVVSINASAVRSISTPEAAVGLTFRVTVDIKLGVAVNGLGLDETLPPGFEIQPVDNAGATFKSDQNQWIWPSTLQANQQIRLVYDVTVKQGAVVGPLPHMFNISGFIESASPAFMTNVTGESQIDLVDCLSIPVAVAHLNAQEVVDLRMDESITADQLQRATSYWLEDAGVPGTCNKIPSWETVKELIARQLKDIPVDQTVPQQSATGATVTRTILTPLPPVGTVYLPNEQGRVFRVQLDIQINQELDGFGVQEILPNRWTVTPVQNDGAIFKPSTRQWVFTNQLSPQFVNHKTIIYQVTVPADESTGTARIQGKSESIIPGFEVPTGGDSEVYLVNCLNIPVAVSHLNTDQNTIDVTLSNLIQFDQIQAAIAFWLEDVSVPGTCGQSIDFETMKTLIAQWLTDTPVDQPLPGGATSAH